MNYQIIPVTSYEQNCSIISCPVTGKAAAVDPGGDVHHLLEAIEKAGVTLEKILLTHGHLDHVGGTGELAAATGASIHGPHKDDDFLIKTLGSQSEMFGFPKPKNFIPKQWLEDGDQIQLGKLTLDVVHCPGHTPGHIVFINHENKLAFVGDVVFKGAIGRTDFPRGNQLQLLQSIKYKLWNQDPDIQFVPGHGPMSTFAEERQSNYFAADHVLRNV